MTGGQEDLASFESIFSFEERQGSYPFEIHRVGEGVWIVCGELKHADEKQIVFKSKLSHFQFRFLLSGETSLVFESGDIFPFEAGTATLFSVGKCDGTAAYHSRCKGTRMVSIVVDTHVLIRVIRVFSSGVRAEFYRRIVPPESVDIWFQTHISPEMVLAADKVLSPPVGHALEPLYLKLKAFELIYLTLWDFFTHEPSADAPVLLPEDVVLIEKAERILRERIKAPPSLRDLAAMAGLNETKLKRGFRMRYGLPVFCYLRRTRMEKSMELLRKGEFNVSEVAWEVGYSNPANFSQVFRQQFGLSPRDYLRGERKRVVAERCSTAGDGMG